VNPPLKLFRTTEVTPTEFLASHPALAPAIERARAKIQAKAKAEAEILASNLGIILRDWCAERTISQISWASALDPVRPEFTLQFLADRLAQKLGEIRFAEFLERFADNLLELDEHERRSQ
jgi:hypothetical protein